MDSFISHQLNQFAGKWQLVDWLIIFIADWLPYVASIFLFGIFLWRRKFSKNALVSVCFSIVIALIVRFPLVFLIQLFINRSRPFVVDRNIVNILGYPQTSSFPSGHASFFFPLAAALFIFDKRLGSLLFLFVTLMGFARIIAGVHWPTDILAGALLGILGVFIIYLLFKRFFATQAKSW
jgi:undecaprenyl-diphosphatase